MGEGGNETKKLTRVWIKWQNGGLGGKRAHLKSRTKHTQNKDNWWECNIFSGHWVLIIKLKRGGGGGGGGGVVVVVLLLFGLVERLNGVVGVGGEWTGG